MASNSRLPPDRRWIRASYVFANSFLTIGIFSLLALLLRTSFVFPSLGPTALLLYAKPDSPESTPRNAIAGHGIGLVCGFLAIALTGLDTPEAVWGEMSLRRVIAAALSLAATGATCVLVKVRHAPAGATTLIVSLGIVTRPFSLLIIEVAVVLLVAQAFVLRRLEARFVEGGRSP